MRLFALASFQDIMLYLFPTLIFMVLFGVGLAYGRFHRQADEQREKEIHLSLSGRDRRPQCSLPAGDDADYRRNRGLGLFLYFDARCAGGENLI